VNASLSTIPATFVNTSLFKAAADQLTWQQQQQQGSRLVLYVEKRIRESIGS
jgi:hypothetical protein